MKEELKIGDLIRFDDEYRSAMKAVVMGSMMATAPKSSPPNSTTAPSDSAVTYMTNFTKYKNGIALVTDIISNKKHYKHERYDIFKITLNKEVRYLYREDIEYAKKIS